MLKIAFNENYIYPLEENHRFPMIKYELIPEKLLRENTCTNDNFLKPNKIDKNIVLLTHEIEYFKRQRINSKYFTKYLQFLEW